MSAPFYQLGGFGYPAAMALATLLGMGFGFVLERAGFGRATVLASQFYGRDNRVLKVMFTAIATATVGLALLGAAGFLDLGALQIPATFIGAAIVGGLLLGVGFIVSGYCPGTAVVAAGSGYTDALFSLLGVAIGSLLFGFTYPLIETFYLSGDLGVLSLTDVLGLSWPWLALGVVALATSAFFLAEWVERFFARRDGLKPPVGDPRTRNRALAALAGVGVAGVVLSLVVTPPAPAAAERHLAQATPVEVAQALAAGTPLLYLVDTRPTATCEADRLPGAMCLPPDDPDGAFLARLPATRALILYGDGDLTHIPPGALGFRGTVKTLHGGKAAFDATIMSAPAAPTEVTDASLADYRLRAALHQHFTGTDAPPPEPVARPKPVVRKVKKGGGC